MSKNICIPKSALNNDVNFQCLLSSLENTGLDLIMATFQKLI